MIHAIIDWFGSPAGQSVLFSAVKILGVFSVLMFIVAYAVWVERKVSAAIQDRHGPNRVGIFGLLQPAADAIKAFLKEDFTPAHVRKVYYWLAPAIVMIPSLLTVAIIPFGSLLGSQKMIIADLNVGVLYTFGIVSLGVYGIVLAGWSSNSKYPFLGGVRSAAQLISYEVCIGLSLVAIFMQTQTLNLTQTVLYQAGHGWLVWQQPLAAFLFLICMFAETNRAPFDFPEAEQELVSGYNIEYSSLKFGLFFLGEYANMMVASMLLVTLFFGGWSLPFVPLNAPALVWWVGAAHVAIFLAKTACVLFLFIWVRWTVPRFRYDQLMGLGWKVLFPLALLNILITAVVLGLRGAP